LYVKKCIRCGKEHEVEYGHRFQKRCPECEIKYPVRKKTPTNLTKTGYCTRCQLEMLVKVGSNNQVCEVCRTKEQEVEAQRILATPMQVSCLHCGESFYYYRKHLMDRTARCLCNKCRSDPHPFKKDPKYEKVIYLLESTDLTRREIKELLGLEDDFVREAAVEKFGCEWYAKRVSSFRNRAGLSTSDRMRKFFAELKKDSDKLEAFFKNRFPSPSKLEIGFRDSLSKLNMPFDSNSWMTIKVAGSYERREVDVKVPLNNTSRKFAVFIDGEAFHGPNAYFKSNSVDKERAITIAFSSLGYFAVRYSESEVKSGAAINHFLLKYREFEKNLPEYYYRNWMTEEEVVKF